MYHPVVVQELVAQHTAHLRSRAARQHPTRATTRYRDRWWPATRFSVSGDTG